MDDWDRKPKAAPSIWLRLKSKDQKIRIRIAARPYREMQVWPAGKGGQRLDSDTVNSLTPGQWISLMRDVAWDISETYHLIVIDRSDGQAKIFQASGYIYGKIRDFAKNPEWGSPSSYDIEITRTEKPGSYYDITPSPNKSDLTAKERELADALMDKLPAGALPTSDPQPDDVDEMTVPEPLPWNQTLAGKTPPSFPTAQEAGPQPSVGNITEPDVVIEDVGDEPINLDDIPF